MSRLLGILSLVIIMSLTNVTAKAEEGPSPEDVAFVQSLLVRFGYNPGPVDGICGDQTTAAVRAFHTDRELPLEPGHIEPQAANVVKNLTSHLTKQVLEPDARPPTVYERALAGDPDAALEVATMYRDGKAVTADKMMAYAWWSVAEKYGSLQSSAMKADIEISGSISKHEMMFAQSLAKNIYASADLEPQEKPVAADPHAEKRGREATM